jgi:hypothetical protein
VQQGGACEVQNNVEQRACHVLCHLKYSNVILN